MLNYAPENVLTVRDWTPFTNSVTSACQVNLCAVNLAASKAC